MPESILPALLLILLVWGTVMYNKLVRHKHLVREAWSGIDVQLKRRHSLLPNLVAVVRAHADYERTTLERITRTRQHDTPRQLAAGENDLTHELRQLIALAEAYPDLKANRSYLDLQHNLSEIEEQIQFARRYYNGTVRNLNVMIESFPSNLVAGLFHFIPAEYFEIELATIRETPELPL